MPAEISISTDELVPVLRDRLQGREFECAVLQARIAQLEKVIEDLGSGLRVVGESDTPPFEPEAKAE